jgi:hypothetical protein
MHNVPQTCKGCTVVVFGNEKAAATAARTRPWVRGAIVQKM